MASLSELLMVGIGGFCGAIARFAVSGAAHRWSGSTGFPHGTLLVNTAGCLAIGWLAGLAESRFVLGSHARLLLFIGFLGSFTTFSTFGYETLMLMRDALWGKAALNAALQLGLGLGAVWLGLVLSRLP